MVQLLKNLGFGKINGFNDLDNDVAEEIISFIEIVYLNCKKIEIPPEIVNVCIFKYNVC